MVTRRYYAIKPKPEMIRSLKDLGNTDLVRPELIAKKNSDRQQRNYVDDLTLIKSTYTKLVVSQLRKESGLEELVRRIASEGFDAFWTVDEFDDCEDFADLISDLNESLPPA